MDRKQKWNDLIEHKNGLMIDYMALPEADRRLRQYYGVSSERELLDILHSDFYYLTARDISQNENCLICFKNKPELSPQERVCPLGIRWKRSVYDAKFGVDEASEAPLRNARTPQDILRHTFPKRGDFDFAPMLEEAEKNADRVIVGGLWSGIMGDSYRMYGFERFLTDMALEPETVRTLINRLTEVYLDLNDAYFQTMKGKMDLWFFGNDFGSQMGLLISEEMWAEFFFENIKKLCGLAKSYGLQVMMHSCGGIRPLIPYLLEAGVEIFDPVQVTAQGMQPEHLIASFGKQMIFHGAVDTQHLLPAATPDEVAAECRRLISLFHGSGYIISGSQVFNTDIPTENIAAMYAAVQSCKNEKETL